MGKAGMDGARCGTYLGYGDHLCDGTEPCEPCREANREWMRAYRTERPSAYLKTKNRQNARTRAMTRLAQLHPGDMERLLQEEMERDDPA